MTSLDSETVGEMMRRSARSRAVLHVAWFLARLAEDLGLTPEDAAAAIERAIERDKAARPAP